MKRQKRLRSIITNAECISLPDVGLFPQAMVQVNSVELENVCSQLRFIGRLLATALRDNFVVGLPLAVEMFAALRKDRITTAALPKPQKNGGMVSVCKVIGDELQAINNMQCSEKEREKLREKVDGTLYGMHS